MNSTTIQDALAAPSNSKCLSGQQMPTIDPVDQSETRDLVLSKELFGTQPTVGGEAAMKGGSPHVIMTALHQDQAQEQAGQRLSSPLRQPIPPSPGAEQNIPATTKQMREVQISGPTDPAGTHCPELSRNLTGSQPNLSDETPMGDIKSIGGAAVLHQDQDQEQIGPTLCSHSPQPTPPSSSASATFDHVKELVQNLIDVAERESSGLLSERFVYPAGEGVEYHKKRLLAGVEKLMATKMEPSSISKLHAEQPVLKVEKVHKVEYYDTDNPHTSAPLDLASHEHEECCRLQRLVDLLEKLLEERVVAPSTPPTPPPSATSECGDEEKNERSNDNVQQTFKMEYKLVDETWDEKSGQYKIVNSTVSNLDKLNAFLFVVRERTDKYSQEKTAYVDIKSAWIRDILREVCRDIRSISLADNKPSVEIKALFHVREDLYRQRDLLQHNAEHDTARKHLNVFLTYLDTAFKPVDDSISILLAERKITYDLLWALFKPNVEVYTTCKGTNASRCLLFTQMEQKNDLSGSKFMHIQTRYLGSDGKALGEVTSSSSIPIFSGETAIELLAVYPLQYHPEKDIIRTQLEECGRRYVSLLGIHHKMYTGRAFDYDEKGNIIALHVNGKIIVDFDCFHENMPNYPSARVQQVRPEYSVLGRCDVLKPVDIDPSQLKPEEFLICSPTVLGFSLEKKRFLEFAVTYISDVVWSTSSFDDVKIPSTQKKAIYSLAHTYFSKQQHHASFSDLVQGKGLGINFLLYGPPGVGKTLTAETLANTFKAPLYIVAAGQIGVDHIRVEKFLKTIFKIASRWQAILLLDEADVFLAERALDPHTNALVSVFLRELEHYEGILFLTTNRMQTFDPAILSRIHLPLRYNALKQDARWAVWRYFIEQAMTKAGPPLYTREIVEKLAEEGLNGREIRNSVLIARSMAEFDGKVVDETYLNDSIQIRKQMEEDFQGAGAILNTNAYL